MVTNRNKNVANMSKAMSEKLSWILGGVDLRFLRMKYSFYSWRKLFTKTFHQAPRFMRLS